MADKSFLEIFSRYSPDADKRKLLSAATETKVKYAKEDMLVEKITLVRAGIKCQRQAQSSGNERGRTHNGGSSLCKEGERRKDQADRTDDNHRK